MIRERSATKYLRFELELTDEPLEDAIIKDPVESGEDDEDDVEEDDENILSF